MFKQKKKLNFEEKEAKRKEREEIIVISIRIISFSLFFLILLINKDFKQFFEARITKDSIKNFYLLLNYSFCLIMLFLCFLGSFSLSLKGQGGDKNG